MTRLLRALVGMSTAVLLASTLAPAAAQAEETAPASEEVTVADPTTDAGDSEAPEAAAGEVGAADAAPARTEIAPFPAGETRLAGSGRYETAITVSSRYAPGVPAVFVATGQDFPDALSASAAAAMIGAPLLLTTPSALPAAVRDEIVRLAPREIFVVGGTGAVSARVSEQLSSIAPVTRMSGSNRYATGLDIVAKSFDSAPFAVVATGTSFPDALASTGVAGMKGGPVILVDGTRSSVPAEVVSTLRALGVREVLIAGGTGVVSPGIQSQLSSSGFSTYRNGGSDRYATAAIINSTHFGAGSASHYFLSTGQDFPDALAGAAVAGYLGMPLYVTRANCMPDPIREAISNLGTANRVVLGGTGAVSAAAASGQSCPKPPPKPFFSGTVTPGAFCSANLRGYYGYSARGVLMQCKTSPTENRLRWREV